MRSYAKKMRMSWPWRLPEKKIAPFYADRIAKLAGLSGAFPETLVRAEQLSVSDEMEQALGELRTLHKLLTAIGLADCLQLDFSMLNDLSYYNGIVFQGYVQGAPRVVLSGGRYDLLMRRFGKQGDAIGFALYLDELTRVLAEHHVWDADVLALYTEADDLAKVNAAVVHTSLAGLARVCCQRPTEGFSRCQGDGL